MKTAADSVRVQIEISPDPIIIDRVDAFLRQAGGGAVNLFVGTTRRFTSDKETIELSYEAAERLAKSEVARIIEHASARWPLLRVAILHRIGIVPVGEVSVLIGVATAHRDESFAACRFLIDELKQHVPIWKKELFADGSTEWVEGIIPD